MLITATMEACVHAFSLFQRTEPAPMSALVAAAVLSCLGFAAAATAAEGSCSARSSAQVPHVVELYTSEGCSSCPPADRWITTFDDRRADVIPMAFHVQYWDYLGWKDRFASADYTARQAQLHRTSGANGSYTPQVIVDGRDWRQWPSLPSASPSESGRAAVALVRDGDTVNATITPGAGAPARLSGWWVALESGYTSAVKAGENNGATLRHDHVVRAYAAVPEWQGSGAKSLSFRSAPLGEGGRPRSVVLVVTDADTGQPVQAVKLGC